jgi:hypothetical protein
MGGLVMKLEFNIVNMDLWEASLGLQQTYMDPPSIV